MGVNTGGQNSVVPQGRFVSSAEFAPVIFFLIAADGIDHEIILNRLTFPIQEKLSHTLGTVRNLFILYNYNRLGTEIMLEIMLIKKFLVKICITYSGSQIFPNAWIVWK